MKTKYALDLADRLEISRTVAGLEGETPESLGRIHLHYRKLLKRLGNSYDKKVVEELLELVEKEGVKWGQPKREV